MRLFAFALWIVLLAAACGSSDGPDRGMSHEAAVHAVNEWMHPDGGVPSEPIGREFGCEISLGGQANDMTIDGTCRWDAERQDGSWLVSFTQRWHCDDFSDAGEGYEPCTDEYGSHAWHHLVYEDGGIEFTGSEGQMPPGMAE